MKLLKIIYAPHDSEKLLLRNRDNEIIRITPQRLFSDLYDVIKNKLNSNKSIGPCFSTNGGEILLFGNILEDSNGIIIDFGKYNSENSGLSSVRRNYDHLCEIVKEYDSKPQIIEPDEAILRLRGDF